MLPVEFYGRHVLQTRMRLHLVAMKVPSLDQNTGFLPQSGPLLVQTLIATPPIEALIGALLPRLPRVIACGLGHLSSVGLPQDRDLLFFTESALSHGLPASAARAILSTYQWH